jgi:hypothetical protein
VGGIKNTLSGASKKIKTTTHGNPQIRCLDSCQSPRLFTNTFDYNSWTGQPIRPVINTSLRKIITPARITNRKSSLDLQSRQLFTTQQTHIPPLARIANRRPARHLATTNQTQLFNYFFSFGFHINHLHQTLLFFEGFDAAARGLGHVKRTPR